MSNYDRNAAIPGAPADYTFAVDAGLRASCAAYITTWPPASA